MKDKKEYRSITSYIEELNKMNKEKAKEIVIDDLLNREITYKDYLYLLGQLKIDPPEDLEKTMLSYHNSRIRKDLSITKINKMNYLETTKYLRNMEEKGLKMKYIKDELLNLWEEGKINGFDYRYVVESMGDEVSIEFLKHAENVGRYYL